MPALPRSTAKAATATLAAALAVAATLLSLRAHPDPLLAASVRAPALLVLAALAGAFALAEVALVHVELRRQAYSFSASGVALVLGVMFCESAYLVLARVAGALAVFAWQRPPPLKSLYNLAAYAFEAALLGYGAHHLIGSNAPLDLATASTCYLLVGGVDLLMSILVLLVISWHQGDMTRRQALEVLVPAAALSATCTGVAFAIAVLLEKGPLGLALIASFMVAAVLIYRSYLVLRRRHQSLELMHEFVAEGVGAAAVEELAEKLLVRVRRILNAAVVELTLHQEPLPLHLSVNEDDELFTEHRSLLSADDWLLTRVTRNDEPIVIPRNVRERGFRQWLVDQQARDALIVPFSGGGTRGVLLVKDRLGEASTFTSDDLTLLQTLAGHVAVALRGVELVQQLRYEATHDALTGLPNRTLLLERLAGSLAEAADVQGGKSCAAVLLLDLDKFKEVNDALGHHVGDGLLQVVGRRLAGCVPPGATVARLGGDEFAILLPPDPRPEEAAHLLADTIGTVFSSPISLTDAVISTRASIGIAVAAPGLDSADVLRHADTAMYASKDSEFPAVSYTPELDAGRAERLALLADLHLALERNELVLHYQPQLDLATGRIVSVEALVRWLHPVHGLLYPDRFIPLAESSGLIEQLTREVLHAALRQCRVWRDAGLDLVVAVNLSAQNVNNPDLADHVATALMQAGLPADRLLLEITESSVMGDPERTVPTLQRLADIGVSLSLDDFGTGYSSLAYLQRLPVCEVKIDRSFISGLSTSSASHASGVLVRSILTLGRSLGLRVVAEGVEDAEVLSLLRSWGCDVVQGYHIGRPATSADVEARPDVRLPGTRANLHIAHG